MKESVKRIRKQTALLQLALVENITAMEKALTRVFPDSPEYREIENRLKNSKNILENTDPAAHTKRIQKQGTRLVKCGCAGCGYNFRITRMWIEVGIPKCPNQDCDRFKKEMEVDLGKDAYAEFIDPKKHGAKRYAPDFVDLFADMPDAGNLDNWKG